MQFSSRTNGEPITSAALAIEICKFAILVSTFHCAVGSAGSSAVGSTYGSAIGSAVGSAVGIHPVIYNVVDGASSGNNNRYNRHGFCGYCHCSGYGVGFRRLRYYYDWSGSCTRFGGNGGSDN